MRMTKIAVASGLALAMTFGVTTAAFAWSDTKADDASYAAWQKEEAARAAAVAAAYKKRMDDWDRWAAAKVAAEQR